MRAALFITLLTLLLVACGQTGSLYLPEDAPATAPAKSATQSTKQGTSP